MYSKIKALKRVRKGLKIRAAKCFDENHLEELHQHIEDVDKKIVQEEKAQAYHKNLATIIMNAQK